MNFLRLPALPAAPPRRIYVGRRCACGHPRALHRRPFTAFAWLWAFVPGVVEHLRPCRAVYERAGRPRCSCVGYRPT